MVDNSERLCDDCYVHVIKENIQINCLVPVTSPFISNLPVISFFYSGTTSGIVDFCYPCKR